MKKAPWKKDPRDRTYGVDSRELRLREREAELQLAQMQLQVAQTQLLAARESIDVLQQQKQYYTGELAARNDKLSVLYQYRAAYKIMCLTGVVMAHEDEFKHLQGADMDEFFGIKKPPENRNPLRGLETMRGIKDEMLAELTKSFDEVYKTYMRDGTGALKLWP